MESLRCGSLVQKWHVQYIGVGFEVRELHRVLCTSVRAILTKVQKGGFLFWGFTQMENNQCRVRCRSYVLVLNLLS